MIRTDADRRRAGVSLLDYVREDRLPGFTDSRVAMCRTCTVREGVHNAECPRVPGGTVDFVHSLRFLAFAGDEEARTLVDDWPRYPRGPRAWRSAAVALMHPLPWKLGVEPARWLMVAAHAVAGEAVLAAGVAGVQGSLDSWIDDSVLLEAREALNCAHAWLVDPSRERLYAWDEAVRKVHLARWIPGPHDTVHHSWRGIYEARMRLGSGPVLDAVQATWIRLVRPH